MDQMDAVNSELEELFQDKKRVRNPLVPIGKSLILSNFDFCLFLVEFILCGFAI